MRSLRATFWIGVYFLLVFSPFIILLVGPRPAGREFWREFSVALGYAGLSLTGFQFIPTARLPFLSDVFPMDTLYLFHHRISLASLYLVLAHPIILFINNPFTLRLLNLVTAPGRARAGVLAVLAMIILVVTSARRKELEIQYEHWRAAHIIFSVVAAAMALVHIFGVRYHTANPVQRALWIAMPALWLLMVIYVRGIRTIMLLRRPYQIVEVRPERGDSWTLALQPLNHPGMRFVPGQVAWLTVQRIPAAIREHPFSFSSSAERTDRIEFTIRSLGDFTSTVKDLQPSSCEPGQCVYVDGPYGVFDLDQSAAPGYVFIAGGIGSAPIMSMLRTMADRDDRRPVLFMYGNQNWERVTFREELEELEKRLNLTVVHVLEDPPEGWTGETGFMNVEMFDRHLPENRAELVYFVCGPIPMMDVVERALLRLDVPLSQIHTERYEMA
ncbi:MAG TPA: oxidoreductase [Chloroflexi bacterium]|jgi:predicted ferric reductase|nr:oxidoreductase [Chloroflexota bacterium]